MKKLIITLSFILIALIMINCTSKSKEVPVVEKDNSSIEKVGQSSSQGEVSNIVALSPQQKLGKRLFIMCEACHNVNEGEPHKVGPNLHGIFGRKAGSVADFKYSEAVMNSDIVWSDETIREWLINPNDYIKGTNMVFVGLPKKRQQDALLSYLHHVAE